MCGIVITRKKNLYNYFSYASSRGLDGFGFYKKDLVVEKRFATSGFQFLKTNGSLWKYDDTLEDVGHYSRILASALNGTSEDELVVLHHRKATSGAKSLEFVHPFESKRFIVLQNGTTPELESWGKVAGKSANSSDTQYLCEYLGMSSDFEGVKKKLSKLSERNIKFGVVIVTDKTTGHSLYYSDGERSFYIEQEDNKILYLGSLTQSGSDKYSNKGWMEFNMDGEILQTCIEEVNKKKVSTLYSRAGLKDKDDEFFQKSSFYKWNDSLQEWEYQTQTTTYPQTNYYSPSNWGLKEDDWVEKSKDNWYMEFEAQEEAILEIRQMINKFDSVTSKKKKIRLVSQLREIINSFSNTNFLPKLFLSTNLFHAYDNTIK